MKRLSTPLGFAGRFAGDTTETANFRVDTTNCSFTARVDNGPLITQSPFQVPLAGPNGQTTDVSVMVSGPSGGSAVVTITPVDDSPEVDLMLIDELVPFPINRYRFNTTTSIETLTAAMKNANS